MTPPGERVRHDAVYAVDTIRRIRLLIAERQRMLAAGDPAGAVEQSDTIASLIAALTTEQTVDVVVLAVVGSNTP